MLSADDVERLAARVLETRYPDADAGFAAGSLIRGQGTALSDLDLVVLYPSLPAAGRDLFLFEDLPVDVFLHDPETMAWVFQADIDAGKSGNITMVAEGRIVGPRPEAAHALQARARQLLDAGPPPLTPEQRDQFRFHITGRLEDLRDPRPPAEMVATGAWLHLALADFILRSRGRWAATGKWTPRALAELDPQMEAAFSAAFDALFARLDAGPLIDFTEQVMAPFGGLLAIGHQSQSPPSARLAKLPLTRFPP